MNLSMKQNQGHREQTGGCQGGGWWERVGLGGCGQQMQTGTYRVDKQQGPIIAQGTLFNIL